MKTDAQLQQDVIEELKWEQSVDASHIGVEVIDGIVTLAGHVHSFSEKWDAEQAAQRVHGVKALAVEIKVTLPGSSKRDDVDIARTIENTIEWSAYLPRDHVTVMVEGGWVTLTGEVDWSYQKQAVAAGIRGLMGVTGVSNELAIRPTISSTAVKADIEAALKRRASTNARNISVVIDGADVTLSGIVGDWSEREAAQHAAWGTPGVHRVVDNITIGY